MKKWKKRSMIFDSSAETARKTVFGRCWCLCVYVCFEDTAFACASLLWGSWNPVLQLCPAPRHKLHSPSQTSAGLWCLLCCPAPDRRVHITDHLVTKGQINNKIGWGHLSLIYMLLLSKWSGEVVWYPWTKNKLFGVWALWGVGLIDCMGKVPRVCLCVQPLFKQPRAWESFASGWRKDKLELHFAKSESLGLA